jgi:uncharacterized protein
LRKENAVTADLHDLANESRAPALGSAIPFEIELKEQRLRDLFKRMGSVLVAFSGGVDSSYVAYIATNVLGGNALCVTGRSQSLAQHDFDDVLRLVNEFGFRHQIIQTDELSNPEYQANTSRRCYFCKSELYSKLKPIAEAAGVSFVIDGSTTDDIADYRPGRAAAAEHSTRSPLIEVDMSKREVRLLSKRAGLPTWDKPASPCLSSRIAYGTPVTIERLAHVERGEVIMRSMGFHEFRVRHHDGLVRLEIAPGELDRALRRDVIDELAKRFRGLGFQYVTLDLHGYRSGSMNEVLTFHHSDPGAG